MKRTTQPIVSVIMPAHNAADFITSAVTSILHQTFTNFELIVVNDGSTDSTKQLLNSLKKQDKRLKVISYAKNKGESAAANIGFAKSKGTYIARMDADDIAHPDRLAKQVAFLDAHPDYIVVGSQAHIIDEHNEIIGEKTFPRSHKAIYEQYGVLHPMLHPAIMVRRSALPNPNQLWANKAEPNDDYFTLFELLQHGKFANLPQKLMSYRMHADNKSMQNIKNKFLNSLKIRMHAVRHFGYKPSIKMVSNALLQSALVLTLPEWVTVGLFMWSKGIKPFDKAFPLLGRIKEELTQIRLLPNYHYAVPLMVAIIVQALLPRRS